MNHRLTIDAFALSSPLSAVLFEARHCQQLAKCRMEIQGGGVPAAIAHYGDRGSPQLVIVEEDDPGLLSARLDQLAEVCAATTRVVVIGSRNDIQLYRSLLARGISDYLPQPVTTRQLLDSIAGIFNDSRSAPRGRVIAFWGARGGVGSSSIAQNTAWQLGQYLHEPVIYIDLDLPFGTSSLAYNVDAKQTVADALQNPERLDDVLMERTMIDYDDSLQILVSAGDCRMDNPITPEGVETLIDLAQKLSGLVVLDLPHLWTDWTRQCLATADEVIITALPDFASLRDCKTLLEHLGPGRNGAAKPKLVLNKIDAGKRSQLTPRDFADSIGLAALVTIPFEPALFGEAGTLGQMIGEVGKTHRVTQCLAQLAESVAGKMPGAVAAAPKRGGGLRQWFRR